MFAFVDTSAWLALADTHEHETDAVERALKQRGLRLMTSSFVLDETVTLVKKRLGHTAALAVGDYLRSDDIELVPIDEKDFEAAWSLFKQRPDKRYSFTDCTSFVLMRRLGIKDAITLDEDFRKEGFRVKP